MLGGMRSKETLAVAILAGLAACSGRVREAGDGTSASGTGTSTCARDCTSTGSTTGSTARSGSGSTAVSTGLSLSVAPAGNIDLQVLIPEGAQVTALQYALSDGASQVIQSGSLATAGQSLVDFELGQVPARPAYTVSVHGASDDAQVQCSGTVGPFAVVAGATVSEKLEVVCTTAPVDAGNIYEPPPGCVTWQSLTSALDADGAPTNGSEVPADGKTAIVLIATASGPNPSAIQYRWSLTTLSGNGVAFVPGSRTGDGTTTGRVALTCVRDTTPNGISSTQVTLTVTDGADAGACSSLLSTVSTTVHCDSIVANDF
jgi:hypothetical protein